jgi:hypothetical protein
MKRETDADFLSLFTFKKWISPALHKDAQPSGKFLDR